VKLNDIVKRVKLYSHRGDQAVTSDQITADILLAVSDANRDARKRIPKRWFHKKATPLVVVQGTPTYALAVDVQEPIIFRYIDDNNDMYPLKIDSDREWFERIFDNDHPEDLPDFYREIGQTAAGLKQIEFFPTPSKSITMEYEYYKNDATDFTTSDLEDEVSEVPEYLHDVLWKGGLYYFLKAFDDAGQVIAKADYAESLELMDQSDDSDQDTDLSWRFQTDRRFGETDTPRFRLDD